MSLEDLGMRALLNLPRDRAIDGIRAYNTMRCVPNFPFALSSEQLPLVSMPLFHVFMHADPSRVGMN